MGGSELSRRATVEGLGTGLLALAVVGSGIMGQRLASGNAALALLTNSLATGAALAALIAAFGSVSGAHFNPAVTVAGAWGDGLRWRDVPSYVAAQCVGACAGVLTAHAIFAEPLFMLSQRTRGGLAQILGEFVATAGLVAVIWGSSRANAGATALAVSAYITAAIWFTSSTSFANPAVTLARAFTDTYTGIRLIDVPGFVAGQALGAAAGAAVCRWVTSGGSTVDTSHRVQPTADHRWPTSD